MQEVAETMRKRSDRQALILHKLRLCASQIIENARPIYKTTFGQELPEVKCYVTPVGMTYGKATLSLDGIQPLMELEMNGRYSLICSFRVCGAEKTQKVTEEDCQKYLPTVLATLVYFEKNVKLNLRDELGGVWVLNTNTTTNGHEFNFRSVKLFSWGCWLSLIVNLSFPHGHLKGIVEAALLPLDESYQQIIFSKLVNSANELRQAVAELKAQISTVRL